MKLRLAAPSKLKLFTKFIGHKEDEHTDIHVFTARERKTSVLLVVFALLLGSIPPATASFLFPTLSFPLTFLLLGVISVLFVNWLGNRNVGMLASGIAVAGATWSLLNVYKVPSAIPIESSIAMIGFLGQAYLMSTIIHRAKRNDLLREFKKREREQLLLLDDVRKKYGKAKEAINARDEFLSLVSHELKTPLTALLLQSQTALHNIRNVSLANFSVANLLKMLENAELQTKQLAKMVNDLLNVSLITTGKLELSKEKVDLSLIAKQVLTSLDEKLKKDNYTVTLHAPAPVVGHFDKMRIEQVITNLLTNGIKYGNRKPIEIHVENSKSTARLSVKDFGIGMSNDEQKRIFERFARGVSAEKYEGIGVGLYITNQIVKAHGGQIKVTSKKGKGSTFTVELPL